MLLSAENLIKSYTGETYQLNDITLNLAEGARVGLVARNGSGKSTLLKILSGMEAPDSGAVVLRKGIHLGFLEQRAEEEWDDVTVLDVVYGAKTPLMDLLRRYRHVVEAMERQDPSASLEKFTQLSKEMDAVSGWQAEANIRMLLSKLGIADEVLHRDVRGLSGGQKKRVALAAALVHQPDILLLDEPTNHLDIDSIQYLESMLRSGSMNGMPVTLLLVSHDRSFLDRVCTEIWELDDGKIFRHLGNYESFLGDKERRLIEMENMVETARSRMRKELEWMRRQPKARGTKSKARIEAFYELQKLAKQGRSASQVKLDARVSRLGEKVVELENATLFVGQGTANEKLIVDNFSYEFTKAERIGIVGPSGVGKSTFLQALVGKLPLDSGTIQVGETVVQGYYDQTSLNDLPEDKRVAEFVQEKLSSSPTGSIGGLTSPIQVLDSFAFHRNQHFSMIDRLSGGERRRLQMLSVLSKNPNFLVLDEPQNDLDLQTIEVLEDFLLDYTGCLVVVSHDRMFMDRLTDHLLVFEGNGLVLPFTGTFSEYLDAKSSSNIETESKPPTRSVPSRESPTKKRPSFKEKKEYEKLEQEIDDLTAEKESLSLKLSDPSSSSSYTDLAEWTERLAFITTELESKTDRWFELAELIESTI